MSLQPFFRRVDIGSSDVFFDGEKITKTGEPLTLPLAGPLAEIAVTLKKMFRDESKPVFDVRDLRYSWYKACAAAGFGVYDSKTRKYRGLQLHDLRRSAVRNLIRAGVDRGTAMSITGHRTESVFERYNITNAADRKDALIRVGLYNSRRSPRRRTNDSHPPVETLPLIATG
jgi:integrase